MTHPAIEALLVAGTTETTYRRAGAGDPVLMLFPSGLADPFSARLFEHLATSARVLLPTQPATVGGGRGSEEERALAFSGWLRDLIGEQPFLLMLDNCEHVMDECARLVEALLRACPRLQILATSREAFSIAGERAWLIPPLAAADAVGLFVARAQDVLPAFSLDTTSAEVVAEICARLDSLPLAIELAAARVRVLAPEQILARLHDRFRLLTAGPRTAIPRHQTLRATIDWSYSLLTVEEQQLLDRRSRPPAVPRRALGAR